MKIKSIIKAFLLIIFATLSYIFIYTGINTKTEVYINYENKSSTSYEVKLLSSDIYDEIEYYDWNYITSLVDDIKINFNYKDTLSEYASGYYKYNIKLDLILYKNTEEEIISKKEYVIKEDTVSVIEDNNCNLIKIDENFIIDFDTYKKIYDKILKDYKINSQGKLVIRINIYEYLGFDTVEKDTPIENEILLTIPINEETIKINSNNINSYGKIKAYSTKEDINYLNIIIGIFFLSLALTCLIFVIKTFKSIYTEERKYKNRLNEILKKYDNIIINVKKIINYKKYNLIYVSSFKELLDVSKKYNSLINYKETQKNKEAIFTIIHEENAWIYKLNEASQK